MNIIIKSLILLTTIAVSHCQFFYNYEQDPHQEIPDSGAYDVAQYKYNSPSVVGQQFVGQVRPAVTSAPRQQSQSRRRNRQNIESAQNNVQLEPEFRRQRVQREPAIEIPVSGEEFENEQADHLPAIDETEESNRRSSSRTSHRGQKRIRQNVEEQSVAVQRNYGPSVFENIVLGQPPSGVYIPADSFLNILRRDTPRIRQSNPVTRAPQPVDESTQDLPRVQPIAPTTSNQRSSSFFVESPSYQSVHRNSEPSEYQQNYNRYQLFVQPPSHLPQYLTPPADSQIQKPQQIYQPVDETPSNQDQDLDDYEYGHRAKPVQNRRVQQPETPAPRRSTRQRQRTRTAHAPQPHVVYNVVSVPDNSEENQPQYVQNQPERVDVYKSSRRTQETSKRRQRPQVQIQSVTEAPSRKRSSTFRPANLAIATLPEDLDDDGIPGTASVDYPTLHVIPKTSFTCSQQAHNGYYADLETSCQVVHLCQFGGAQDSFLCPNGTIFSQEKLSCQWWYKVDCQNSPRFYSINDSLYKVKKDD